MAFNGQEECDAKGCEVSVNKVGGVQNLWHQSAGFIKIRPGPSPTASTVGT